MRKLVRRNRLAVGAGGIVFLSLVLGLGGATWMYVRSNRARHAAELARANEAKLRVRAEIAGDVARAAVLLKRGAPQDADKLLERIPPALAQPSLESAETFEVLALWHARQGRWRQAGDRFSALVHSLTSVDESDAETISIYLLPAAASLCEAGDLAGYDALRTLAIKRFGGTRNPVVAEQVVKACLIRPADRDLLARLKPLERLMLTFDAEARVAEPHDRNLAGWRAFSIALIEYRGGNPDAALNAIEYCMKYSGENPARDALVDTLAAMIWHRKGRREEVLPHLEAARKSIETRFAATPDIFREHEPKWQDWINARILLREAAGQIGD